MYDGSLKKVEDIGVGDLLMGPDSLPRTVLKLHTGTSDMVRIVPKRGKPFIVTSNHILPIIRYSSKGRHDRVGGKIPIIISENIEAKDWFSFSKTRKHCTKLWKPENVQFPTPNEELTIPPYILGLWLGDGSSGNAGLTTMDEDIAYAWQEWGESNNCQIRVESKLNNKASTYTLKTNRGKINTCLELLRNLKVLNNKHIPDRYLFGSRKERLELLAGLSDTDGNWNYKASNFEITQVRKHLAEQILFLVRSLGFAAEISQRIIKGKYYYRVSGSTLNADEIPVKCSRKVKGRGSKSNQKHVGFTVEPYGKDTYYGFEIDGDNLYLLDDFTVTHNTGKSSLAKAIMNATYSCSYITPTNLLVNQFLQEFPDTRTLHKVDYYQCPTWQRPCIVTKGKMGGCCKGCPMSRDISQAVYKRGPGVYNYYTYAVRKLYRDVLIIDEAHNIIPTIKSLIGVTLWQHDLKYPDNMYKPEQVLRWIDSLSPKKQQNKKIAMLREAVSYQVPNYVMERTAEEFNGKGTLRGQPEMRDCIKLYPVDISEAPPMFWPREVQKIILMSATIGPKDIEQLGLSRKKILYIDCPSPIPENNRPIVLDCVESISRSNMEYVLPRLAEYIEHYANKHPNEKGVIHTTYQIADKLQGYLVGARYLFHDKFNKKQQYEKFRASTPGSGTILVCSGMYEGIDLPEDLGRWQILTKIPWASLGNRAVQHLSQLDPEWYNWETMKVVIQACGRICRTPTDYGITYIYDASFRRLQQEVPYMFPYWFTDALIDNKLTQVGEENSDIDNN